MEVMHFDNNIFGYSQTQAVVVLKLRTTPANVDFRPIYLKVTVNIDDDVPGALKGKTNSTTGYVNYFFLLSLDEVAYNYFYLIDQNFPERAKEVIDDLVGKHGPRETGFLMNTREDDMRLDAERRAVVEALKMLLRVAIGLNVILLGMGIWWISAQVDHAVAWGPFFRRRYGVLEGKSPATYLLPHERILSREHLGQPTSFLTDPGVREESFSGLDARDESSSGPEPHSAEPKSATPADDLSQQPITKQPLSLAAPTTHRTVGIKRMHSAPAATTEAKIDR
ncbi:hypothetical protein Cgig2_030244 [Carnegiea gigantea]|uniref:Transmembrane protein n=1 Tax=Carnegiea gigantea TaxID=171969 RepID=A0A9Q1QIR7_9CARY|nr:hypothetical protein Cgig2_030244 [Carnegiea gigantea]